MPKYLSLEDMAAASDRLFETPATPLPDLYSSKMIPARALVCMTAKEIAMRVLFPAKKPTLAYDEWIASLTANGIANDFEAQNLWLDHLVSDSGGWRIVSTISGISASPWGITLLTADYHDFSSADDVDFMLRLGGLQMGLLSTMKEDRVYPSPWELARVLSLCKRLGAKEPDKESLSWAWPKDVKMGAVLCRVLDSREYGLRTGTLTMSPFLADEFVEYYEGKLRAAARGIDQEDPHIALEWDRAHPRDSATGYRFVELEAPTADTEALLSMRHNAGKRERAAKRDIALANTEIGQAYSRGKMKPGRFRLPTGVIASVFPPRRGIKKPSVRFKWEGKAASEAEDEER